MNIPFNPFKNKTDLIPFGIALILLGIIFMIAYLAINQSRPQPSPTPDETSSENIPEGIISPTISPYDFYFNSNVERIVPSTPLPLTPGLPYSFTVYFREPPVDYDFRLTYSPLYEDKQATPVGITVSQVDNKTFQVKTVGPIQQYSEYVISVFNVKTKEETFHKGYMTNDVIPSYVPTNNLELAQFLPYETSSYILEFFRDRNVYIFHFKYNSDSPDSAERQFDKAQADAKRFIQSKGININTIVIEWRNS